MKSPTKSDLLGILASDVAIHTTPEMNNYAPIDTCVFIDGHALIQSLGKPVRFRIFADYSTSTMCWIISYCIMADKTCI